MNVSSLVSFRDEYTKIAAKKKRKKSKKDNRTFPISRALKNEKVNAGFGALQGALSGGAAGALLGKKLGGGKAYLATKGGFRGAAGGAMGGALTMAIANAIHSRATLGRARKNQKGIGRSEQKIIKALRATKSGREGSSNPFSRALTSVPGMAALGAAPGAILAGIALKKGGLKNKELAATLLGSAGLAAGGATALGGTTALNRVLKARGHRGENRVGRKRSYSQELFENDTAQTKILKALKKAKD